MVREYLGWLLLLIHIPCALEDYTPNTVLHTIGSLYYLSAFFDGIDIPPSLPEQLLSSFHFLTV